MTQYLQKAAWEMHKKICFARWENSPDVHKPLNQIQFLHMETGQWMNLFGNVPAGVIGHF